MLWMILSWWTHLFQTIKCTTLSMNLIATMDFGWCFVIFKWIPEVISHCKSLNDESIKGSQHQYVIDIGFGRMLSSLLGSPKSSEQCLVPKHTALCSQPALQPAEGGAGEDRTTRVQVQGKGTVPGGRQSHWPVGRTQRCHSGHSA